jgi:hypothetical protein
MLCPGEANPPKEPLVGAAVIMMAAAVVVATAVGAVVAIRVATIALL